VIAIPQNHYNYVIKAVLQLFLPHQDRIAHTVCNQATVAGSVVFEQGAQILHKIETGEDLPKPDAKEVIAMILRHADLLLENKGEYIGIREMRKHAAWYTAGLRNASHIRGQINEVQTRDELEEIMMQLLAL